MSIKSFKDQYSFLSNFYPCRVVMDKEYYPSVEHAFQAAKTSDKKVRYEISVCGAPGRAKRLGRGVELRADWEKVKIPTMHMLVLQKFRYNPTLLQKLLNTGDEFLEEGNTWGDRFWGTVDGAGENHLGKILMDVRRILNQERL